eukprot:TRINITY_DN24153_c0_g1_i1.p2 TRINITY_DN24153_c0_g1~~TRINITY_DN24153_c0_g1_i1.p2  ORF type:complete len:124 (-),score=18.01 TRINITY_DN24153_c0_g1_i1:25-396(-)
MPTSQTQKNLEILQSLQQQLEWNDRPPLPVKELSEHGEDWLRKSAKSHLAGAQEHLRRVRALQAHKPGLDGPLTAEAFKKRLKIASFSLGAAGTALPQASSKQRSSTCGVPSQCAAEQGHVFL